MKKKIILIDDDHKLWGPLLSHIIKDMYDQWAEFEALQDISDGAIGQCYINNPDALFIQDNDLTKDSNCPVIPGIEWIKVLGNSRSIILHSGDNDPALGFKAAQYGARLYMKKDDPNNQMTNAQMQEQIIGFHKVIIKYLGLVPEYIWMVYLKMDIIQIEEPPDIVDPDHAAQQREDEREL